MDTVVDSDLVEAASNGDVVHLEKLLATEQLTESSLQALLTTAAWKCQGSVIDFLLSKYKPNSIQEETVRAGIYSGSIPLFSSLLSADASIINMQFDRRGTPIILATMSQKPLEFLKFLLEAGADPNQDPEVMTRPLALVAAFYQDCEVVDLLLKHGSRLDHTGALGVAASRNNEVMVRYLLKMGIDHDDDRDQDHISPSKADLAIHAAATKGHVAILRILLEHGVDPDAKDGLGNTAAQLVDEAEKKGTDLSEVRALLHEFRGK